MNLLLLLSFISVFIGVQSYKVLVVFPLPVKSLSILGQSITKHLLDAGHEVTYVTVFPLKNVQNKNFRQIDLSDTLFMLEDAQLQNMTYIMEASLQSNDAYLVQEFAIEASKLMFENDNTKKFLEDKSQKFDVVIADLIEAEVYSAFAELYECPMIWFYSMGAQWTVLRLIDNPTNPAYDPDGLSLNLLPFTFLQRVEELWTRIKGYYYRNFLIAPQEEEIYKKYFGPLLAQRGKTLPSYQDVVYNVSFIFGNDHNAANNRPSTPDNFKNIGGVHVEKHAAPLPKDLQELIENSKHGVIYFSMGSFFKGKMLPKILVAQLLEMFGELEQTVLWKFEEKLDNVPKNVHILHWAPQPSILAHPNCLFFITHGGLLSSLETIHAGVSTIGIPIYYDQFINVNKAVANGYAIKVDLNYDLPKNLRTAIREMLSNDRYKKKAKELSEIFHDRVVPPGEEFIYWVQHVVRTRGAPHLRSPALRVPLYQKLYLDLVAVIAIVFTVLLVVIKRISCIITVTESRKKVD